MNMNFRIPCILISAALFSACTKEIDLPLENASNKVVIEGEVHEGVGPHTVRLSRSVAFDTPNDFPGITNATVTLSDDQGNSEQLTMTSNGLYSSSGIVGVQGRNYHMSVIVEGSTYVAECRMPVAVALDSVRVDSLLVLGTYEKVIFATYTDPAGLGNRYRFSFAVNGEQQKGILVQNDLVEDGVTAEQPLNFMDDGQLLSGDTVEASMSCISQEVYRYLSALAQNIGGETAAPSDPPSNISNGALGYFSAHTTSRKTVIVP